MNKRTGAATSQGERRKETRATRDSECRFRRVPEVTFPPNPRRAHARSHARQHSQREKRLAIYAPLINADHEINLSRFTAQQVQNPTCYLSLAPLAASRLLHPPSRSTLLFRVLKMPKFTCVAQPNDHSR